jgi:hypothetical protein
MTTEFKSIEALKKLGALKKKDAPTDKGDFFGNLMSKKANEASDSAKTPDEHAKAAKAHKQAAKHASGGLKAMHLSRAKGHEEKAK